MKEKNIFIMLVIIALILFIMLIIQQRGIDKEKQEGRCGNAVEYSISSDANFTIFQEDLGWIIHYGKKGLNEVYLPVCKQFRIDCDNNVTINFTADTNSSIPTNCFRDLCDFIKLGILKVCEV